MTQILCSVTFGEFSRYRLDAFRTRFGSIMFMVLDVETVDPLVNRPSVIRQSATVEEAIAGLAEVGDYRITAFRRKLRRVAA